MIATTIPPMSEDRLLDTPKTRAIIDCSNVTLWRYRRKDPTFPKPLRADPTNPRSRLKFRLSEILSWIENKQSLTTEAAEAGAGSLNLGR